MGRRVRPCACLGCGTVLDRAMQPADLRRRPKPGSLSICIDCGHIAVFAEDMGLRALTDAEMVELAGNRTLIAIMRARAAVMQPSSARDPNMGSAPS